MPRIHENFAGQATAADQLWRVARLLRFRAAAFLRAAGLDVTPEQWGLLLRLAGQGGVPLGELVDPVLADHPNVTRMVDGLVKRGLAERLPNPEDRRGVLVRLTGQGKDLLDATLPDLVEEKERYFHGLDRAEVTELQRMLALVEANLVHPPEE